MPRSADRGVGLSQRGLLRRDHRALAEVGLDHADEPDPSQRGKHVGEQRRRIDAEDSAAHLHPLALGDLVRGLGLELFVVPLRRGLPLRERVAGGEGSIDSVRQMPRLLRLDEPADKEAAMAQDRGAQKLRGQVLRADLDEFRILGQRVERRSGEVRLLRLAGEHLHALQVEQVTKAPVALGIAPGAIGGRLALDLRQQLLHVGVGLRARHRAKSTEWRPGRRRGQRVPSPPYQGRCALTEDPHPTTPTKPRRAQAPFGAVLTLTATVGIAAFSLIVAVAVLAIHPSPVPGLAPLTQRQSTESALYAIGFFVVLPMVVLFVPRLADAIEAGPNREGLPFLGASLTGGLAVAVLVARALPWASGADALAAFGLWSCVAIAVLARARSSRPWPALDAVKSFAAAAWWIAGGLFVVSLLVFTTLASISLLPLAIAAGVGVLVAWGVGRGWALRLPRPRGRWGVAIDIAVVVLLLFVVPDLVIFEPGGSGLLGYEASIIQFHQD